MFLHSQRYGNGKSRVESCRVNLVYTGLQRARQCVEIWVVGEIPVYACHLIIQMQRAADLKYSALRGAHHSYAAILEMHHGYDIMAVSCISLHQFSAMRHINMSAILAIDFIHLLTKQVAVRRVVLKVLAGDEEMYHLMYYGVVNLLLRQIIEGAYGQREVGEARTTEQAPLCPIAQTAQQRAGIAHLEPWHRQTIAEILLIEEAEPVS